MTFRNWTDGNRDVKPDCDLANPVANGECGAMADPNFGKAVKATTYDPDIKYGWGKRGFNWEFSTGVQHQLVQGLSVEVTYFRRWYGNFVLGAGGAPPTSLTSADNQALNPADFDPYCITAPSNPGLPNGGGNQICGLFDVNPSKFGIPAKNYVTFSSQYGNQIEHWNGVDIVFNARLPQGIVFQGGMNTGSTVTDVCDIVSKLTEIYVTPTLTTPQSYCHVRTPFQPQVKLLGSYQVPRIKVQFSATVQSLAGPQLSANFNVPSAVVAQSLGRPLSGGAANATVNLIPPATMYGDRLNQLDLRFSKILPLGTRTVVNFDLYNALNASPVTSYSTAYGTFLQPQQILASRFGKVSVQFNF